MDDKAALLQQLAGLDKHPVVNDALSEEFFATWPLERLFRAIAGSAWDPGSVDLLYTVLSKLLHTQHGSTVAAAASAYFVAALESPLVSIRKLGVEQLHRLLDASSSAETQQEYTARIAACLEDPDTGIAAAAEKALAAFTAHNAARLRAVASEASPSGQLLRRLATHRSATLRLRACSTVLSMAAGCLAEAPTFLQDCGILTSLVQEISNGRDDPLSLLAALELLRDLTSQGGGALALPLAHLVLPALAPCLEDPSLLGSVLPPAASMLAAALRDVPYAGAAQVPGCQAVLGAIAGALDPAGGAPHEDELAALDAVGQLSLPKSGAELLLLGASGGGGSLWAGAQWVADRALARESPQELRVAALHALASVAGGERGHEAAALRVSAACLSHEAERALRTAVYTATTSGASPSTPSESLSALLSRPFEDVRIATYRCTAVLALRPWGAQEVCSHPDLLSRLLSADGEAGKVAAEWRHTCVLSLRAAVSQAGGTANGGSGGEVLRGLVARIEAAAAAGPFGVSGGVVQGAGAAANGAAAGGQGQGQAFHHVATMNR